MQKLPVDAGLYLYMNVVSDDYGLLAFDIYIGDIRLYLFIYIFIFMCAMV